MHPLIKQTRNSRLATRGLTLVEMLIGMAITLVMMAAVVNLFANIGSGIRVRRASMELGTQLRTARSRLFKDLAGATAKARPKLPNDDHDDGYLEIIEGQFSDKNPSLLVAPNNIDNDDGAGTPIGLQHQTSIIPRDNTGGLVQWDDDNQNGVVDSTAERNSVRSIGSALGDYDDILALTVRSESEPFVGQWFNTATNQVETIESDLAEVIWFSVENPADGTLGEPGMRTVYRRVLLIAPWLDGQLEPPTGTANTNTLPADLLNFYRRNDVSVRRINTGGGLVWVPNTLSDLTKRENRFAHIKDPDFTITSDNFGFPFLVENRAIRQTTYPTGTPPLLVLGPLRPFGGRFDNAPLSQQREGEDVMLNDVLAFDLRVYDAEAPQLNFNNSNPVIPVEPADAGWRHNPNLATPTHPIIGTGAYVDLFYWGQYAAYGNALGIPLPSDVDGDGLPDNNNPSVFSEAPDLRSSTTSGSTTFVTYDTWPYHYEDDGINQDGDTYIDETGTQQQLVDEGTDGLDNNNINGVDDALEREAPPPYDHPLRAMQVKIRVYDRDTRQIREATVTRNFVPQ